MIEVIEVDLFVGFSQGKATTEELPRRK